MNLKVTYNEKFGAYLLTIYNRVSIVITKDEAQFLMDELDWALNPRETSK